MNKHPNLDLDKVKSLLSWPDCILVGYRGSVAHGMWTGGDPDSIDDVDLMAVVVPPLDHYFGLREFGTRGTMEVKYEELDIVVYDLRKFVSMLAGGNPNVLTFLHMNDACYLKSSPTGDRLRAARDLFDGKHVYRPLLGYAHGQQYKMTHGAMEGYMGEKRKGLVEKYGYDCKNAAHAVRLLKMGIEYLTTGTMNVDRSAIDADQLLSIKRGEWTLDAVNDYLTTLYGELTDAYAKSKLPDGPDMDKVNNLLVSLTVQDLTVPILNIMGKRP
jgi:uncharacterized protein